MYSVFKNKKEKGIYTFFVDLEDYIDEFLANDARYIFFDRKLGISQHVKSKDIWNSNIKNMFLFFI